MHNHWLRLTCTLLLTLTCVLPASGATEMAKWRQLFQQGRCDLIKDELRAHRSEIRQKGRISLPADFMLSVCLCQLPGLDALMHLPSVYRNIAEQDREIIRQAVSDCRNDKQHIAAIPNFGAVVWGKGGRVVIRLENDSADFYAERIFSHDAKGKAIADLKNWGYSTVITTQNFIITGDIGEQRLKAAGDLFEDVLDRLAKKFDLATPRSLITVYLFGGKREMRQHARKQHAIDYLPGEIFAYTFPLDASITIWASGGMGTIGHELFHALLDQNAPYSPPWLNEGVAALFEEYRLLPDDGIEGIYRSIHWRVKYLKDTDQQISIDTLINMDWSTLDGKNLQLNHATAKFFIMYLQEKNKLRAVLGEYLHNDLYNPVDDAKVLTKHLSQEGISQINEDFDIWLRDKINE